MHLFRPIPGVILGCLFMPVGLFAQQASDPLSVLHEVDVGDRIRVLAPPDTIVEGKVARVYAQSLILRLDEAGAAGAGSPEWEMELASIEALWTRGRQTWLGAAIGGGAGAVLGGLTAAVASGLCEYECDGETEGIVVGSLLGGAAGAVLGALIGSAFTKWSLQFEK